MTNNDILKKLRVALKLRDEDIVAILALVDFRISKSELGAFFRKEDHPKYVECGDQILRNFLNGLVIHLRGPMPDNRQADTKKNISTLNKDISDQKSSLPPKPKDKNFTNKKPFIKTRPKKKSND